MKFIKWEYKKAGKINEKRKFNENKPLHESVKEEEGKGTKNIVEERKNKAEEKVDFKKYGNILYLD